MATLLIPMHVGKTLHQFIARKPLHWFSYSCSIHNTTSTTNTTTSWVNSIVFKVTCFLWIYGTHTLRIPRIEKHLIIVEFLIRQFRNFCLNIALDFMYQELMYRYVIYTVDYWSLAELTVRNCSTLDHSLTNWSRSLIEFWFISLLFAILREFLLVGF